jgi:hypothetical protein
VCPPRRRELGPATAVTSAAPRGSPPGSAQPGSPQRDDEGMRTEQLVSGLRPVKTPRMVRTGIMGALAIGVLLTGCGASRQSVPTTTAAAHNPVCPPGYRYVDWDAQHPSTSHTCHLKQPDIAAGPITSAHPKCPPGFHGPYGEDHICWSNKQLIVAPKSG